MPLRCKEQLKNQKKIDVSLENDKITPCYSSYSEQAMLITEKNGKLGLFIDCRQLNKQAIKYTWPILSIEEIFDKLEGSACFNSVDMYAGFYQFPMQETSQEYIAVSTPVEFFKWLRMPMGPTGSTPTFQCLVDKVLVGPSWKRCVPCLDDIIVFLSTPEEHFERLKLVFERFREHNLQINPANFDFLMTKVQFLGHIVSKDRLEVNPSKVKCLQNIPVAKGQSEVK